MTATGAPPPAWPVSQLSYLAEAAASTCEVPSVFRDQLKCHCFLKPWLSPLRHGSGVSPAHPCPFCNHQASVPSVPSAWNALPALVTCLVPPHHSDLSCSSTSSERPHPVPSPPPTPVSSYPCTFFFPPQHITLLQCGLPAYLLHLTLSHSSTQAGAVCALFTTALLAPARHLACLGCSDLFFSVNG